MTDVPKSALARNLLTDPIGVAAASIGIAGLVLVQQLATVGGSGLLGETLTNASHVPLFAALTLLLIRALGYPSWPVLLLACVAVAAATEAMQMLTGRNASLFDLGLDLLGALPVIGAVAVTRRLRGPRAARRAAVWAVTAVLVAIMTVAAPARVLLAYHERDRAFPALLIPSAWEIRPLLSSNSRMRIVPGGDDWSGHRGERVLEVVWAEERYPGIVLSEVVPRWDAFATLAVDVYLPPGTPMPLTAAVGHEGREGTAAHLRRIVQPGPQRLLYDLETLLATADGAPPRISKLVLHTNRGNAGRRLLIAAVRLLPGGAHDAANAGNLAASH
jgi:hypothetical protein